MITVTVDPASRVPPSEQLHQALADAIRGGVLAAGTRLPTVRQLAHDLGLAPNTVAKAYRVLDEDGLVETDGRRGTRVAAGSERTDEERRRLLTAAAERYLAEARRLGATLADAQERVTALGGAEATITPGPPSPDP